MQKVFWDNPYQATLITTGTAIDGNTVLFDKGIERIEIRLIG